MSTQRSAAGEVPVGSRIGKQMTNKPSPKQVRFLSPVRWSEEGFEHKVNSITPY
jgi:hypothetical protein